MMNGCKYRSAVVGVVVGIAIGLIIRLISVNEILYETEGISPDQNDGELLREATGAQVGTATVRLKAAVRPRELSEVEIGSLVRRLEPVLVKIKEWEASVARPVDELTNEGAVWLSIPPLADDMRQAFQSEINRFCREINIDVGADDSNAVRRLKWVFSANEYARLVEVQNHPQSGWHEVCVYSLPQDKVLSEQDIEAELRDAPSMAYSINDRFVRERFGHLFKIVEE